MLLLKSLKLKNFLSHETTTLNFSETQKVLLDGKSGAGKSSIFDAITWCLFGNGRVENKTLIRKGCDKAEVSIVIIDKELNKEYEITRSITVANKHTIDIKEVIEGKKSSPLKLTGVKESQLFIEKNIIRASYMLFVNSVAHQQDSVDNFCNQTSQKRKDILMEILHSNDYDEYLMIAKEQLSDVKTRIGVLDSQITEKNKFISENYLTIIGIEGLKEKVISLKEKYSKIDVDFTSSLSKKDELVSKLAEIKASAELFLSIKNSITNFEEELKKTNKAIIDLEMVDIKSLEKDVVELNRLKLLLKEQEDKRELLFKYNNDLANITSQTPVYRDFEIDILKVNKQIKEWNDQEIIVCPKCNTPYPQFKQRKEEHLKKLNEELEHLVSQQNFYHEQRRLTAEKIEKLGLKPEYDLAFINKTKAEIETLSLSERKLNEIKQNKVTLIAKYSEDINRISKSIEENKIKLGEIGIKSEGKEKIETELAEIQKTIYNINNEKTTLNSEMSELQAKIIYLENLTTQITKNKKDLAIMMAEANKVKENVGLLELMREMFGPNGIKAILIDLIVPDLENRINSILSKLSDFRINIETQRDALSGDNTLEGLFLNIIDSEGNIRDYNSYSGGEKNKITAAIFEGLASLQNAGFRILDESVVGLDDESEEKFSEVILNIRDNVNQLLCISHLQSIKDLFETKIEITKINGISKII
jgi:exonuclease SbcC